MKHIVLLSGGHSSGIVAIEVARRFGTENLILLNHDISEGIELEDVKRFKKEVSEYLGVDITYANHSEWKTITPVQVCVNAGTWVNPNGRQILCTHRLKTKPFYDWLESNYEEGDICYYGYDRGEPSRITRRGMILGEIGVKTDFPLAKWTKRTIRETKEVGIERPAQYDVFNHANCMGCLKAGWQHWYVIYCLYPERWEEAKKGEESIGYSVHSDYYFEDREELFKLMRELGIEPTEKTPSGKFWAASRRKVKQFKETKTVQFSIFDMPVQEKTAIECTGDCRL